ncbi:MAG: aminopeptidase [Clostridia bacterium]
MSLMYNKKIALDKMTEGEKKASVIYSKEYINFLKNCKTEWECANFFEQMLQKKGFKNIDDVKNLKAGDKVYFLNKEKSIYAAIIGKEDIKNGMLMIGAHVDSPRLDLKPMPLCESFNIALFRTQYYGGIKKYQWLTIPLAMHGIIYNSKGEKISIVAGEQGDDYCFNISDLLPHMAREQMKKSASEFIDPEDMRIVVGSYPDESAEKEKIKANVMKILNEKYGIEEIDFARSEIEFVPAHEPKFLGFDKGLIGGYGHDDRVCAYAAINALVDVKETEKTIVALAVDKEEVGSIGTTGMQSQTFDMFVKDIIEKTNNSVSIERVYYNSKMLSADVSTCMDLSSAAVVDEQNGNIVGHGISLEKYTGGSGKGDASEASAKYMSEIMSLFDREKVAYQMGTLGKIDKGGGGTIAYILANKGVSVVDCGTPVISMHSPYETVSVLDVFMTYKAYKAFYENLK